MPRNWFNKRNKGNADVPVSPAAVPEVTQLSAPVAELEPEPRLTLPTEPSTPPAAMEIPGDKVAARAYEIWIEKGRPAGTEVQNWLEAENELRHEYAAKPAPKKPARKSR